MELPQITWAMPRMIMATPTALTKGAARLAVRTGL